LLPLIEIKSGSPRAGLSSYKATSQLKSRSRGELFVFHRRNTDMSTESATTDTTLDRLPPQSLDSEQAVLGALLVSGDGITRVVDLIEPEYFYRKAHQVIYAAMLDLFDNNEPIDIVTVSQYLKDEDKLDGVGGRQYITDLSLAIATTANLEYYARIVQEKALLRHLIKAGTEIVSQCYDEPDADAAIDRAEHLIFNLAQKRSMQQLVHIKHIVETSFQKIEERYENRDSLSGVPSGFYDLDALTSGFQPSDLIIVAARPSMGKTALCLNIAQHVSVEHKVPVAIFSLEMSKEQLVSRMLCSEASIDANRLRTGHLHTNDWTHLAMAMGRLGEAPIFIDDSALLNVLEIRAKARRLKAEMKGLGLIIVDYIQLLQGRKQTDNRVQEVSEISRSLKTLAREISVPVIALSQLSRAVEARQNKRPMLSDLRESGCLTGDTLVYLPDLGVYKPIAELIGQSGFNVMALDTESWKLEPCPVTKAFSTGRKPVFKLTTKLNRTIRATANHKFLTVSGWKRLDELTPGSRIALPVEAGLTMHQAQYAMASTYSRTSSHETNLTAERTARVASKELTRLSASDVYWDEILSVEQAGEEEVFDLTVDRLHNFVANDIVVHNSIEQDSDLVMFIYRDEYYNPESERRGEAEIIIAKQRNGPTGTVDLLYQASITRFLNKVHNQYSNP
jgi:replicative DNA helicase